MPAKKPDFPKRKLKVTQRNQISSGESDHGKWTLWGIKAVTEAGEAVDLELRSFKDCPIGELVEYGVEASEYNGQPQYLLHPPKKDLKQSVDELRAEVEALTARVVRLEAGEPAASPRPQSPASGPMIPASSSSSRHPDDEIPF